MDLRVKIQPKEIFIYSMYNFWAGLRGIGCIILTVLVIIAAAVSEEFELMLKRAQQAVPNQGEPHDDDR